jgi:hypothetical protein
VRRRLAIFISARILTNIRKRERWKDTGKARGRKTASRIDCTIWEDQGRDRKRDKK